MSIHITEKIIRDYQLPANRKSVVITDLELPGFGVQKTAAGSMSFIVRYRNAEGRQKQERFATVGEISVATARAKAYELLTKYKQQSKIRRAKKNHYLLSPIMDDFFYTIYYPRIRLEARSHKTHAGLYRTHIQPLFGQRRMADITEEEVFEFVHHLRNKPVGQGNYRKPVNRLLAPGTVSRILVLLRHLFNVAKAVPTTNVKSSPVDALKISSKRRFVGKFLTAEQLHRLLAAAEQSSNRDFADIFKMLVGTGLRRNNVLRMRWEWYDTTRGIITIPAEEDKGKRGLVVHLSMPMRHLLDGRRQTEAASTAWVFANPSTGKPYHSCRNAWVRVREIAGLESIRMHDLRHTHASMMLESGANLIDVQHALGHANVSTTQIYTHISEQRRREQAERTATALSIFN